MLKFSADVYTQIVKILGRLCEFPFDAHKGAMDKLAVPDNSILVILKEAQAQFDAIELKACARSVTRLIQDIGAKRLSAEVFQDRVHCLAEEVEGEIDSQLLLWIPPHRAGYHKKSALDVLGQQCLDRFPISGIAGEMDHALKCHAYGEYTAAAFHLMRTVEAGVRAIARAIGHPIDVTKNWGKFFKQYDQGLAVDPRVRTGIWLTYSDFLDAAGGNMRAVKNAWRNNTMHLGPTYDEEQAKHLLEVVPAFMRHLASHVDEDGNLYP